MTILDRYLSLDYDFVHQILEQSLEVKQFWKDLGINDNGLRKGRGYEDFLKHFNINIIKF